MNQEFKKFMSCFATGVVVITAKHECKWFGITINSFNSVSLHPPMVLYSLDKNANRFSLFHEAEEFLVNILSEEQQQISTMFAYGDAHECEKYFLPNGTIENVVCSINCATKYRYEGGDHKIIVAEVKDYFFYNANSEPLIYLKSQYCKIQKEE